MEEVEAGDEVGEGDVAAVMQEVEVDQVWQRHLLGLMGDSHRQTKLSPSLEAISDDRTSPECQAAFKLYSPYYSSDGHEPPQVRSVGYWTFGARDPTGRIFLGG